MGYDKRSSITTKFVLWFLLISLIPLAAAGYISYESSRKALKDEISSTLSIIADNRAGRVNAFLNEKKGDVARLTQMPELFSAIEKFKAAFGSGGPDSPEYQDADKKFRPLLAYYQRASGYDDIFIVSSEGDIVFSLKGVKGTTSLYERILSGQSQLAKTFVDLKESSKEEVSDFEYDSGKNKGYAYIGEPVMSGTEFLGAVIVRMAADEIADLVKDYSGLGETGETAVAARVAGKAVFITPLRFDSEAGFKREINLAGDADRSAGNIDIDLAVKSEKIDIIKDYRGEEVMVIWRYLPSFKLGMVVKMDTREVFTSADKLSKKLILFGLCLIVIVAAAAVIVARTISSPIRELTEVSRVISSGDLSARAEVSTGDEVGELAYSFNQMTDSLVQAKAKVEEERATIEEQAGLLEKANHELDSFVYTVSHDLRAPLRGIEAFASFLEEDYKNKLDEEGRDHITEIVKGVNRMNNFIEDLLTLSRISRIKNPYEDVDINKLIADTAERIKFDIEKCKVDLKVQKGLPVVRCDRIKINEVFLNLINNAIKYSSKNKKENPRVQVGYEDRPGAYEFYIRDNGIGIDPKDHDKVFEIFKRIKTEEEFEGTGAGLSIVKKIIDDHHGKIWIVSELGKGAEFRFTIPKGL